MSHVSTVLVRVAQSEGETLVETRLQAEDEPEGGVSGQRQGICIVSGSGGSLRSSDGLVSKLVISCLCLV